uniref:cbb3-type cytochrome c oxidase subunit I n=1 Tax=Thalassolituus sp. TaxID=2030822 RepID=UPI002A7F5F6B
ALGWVAMVAIGALYHLIPNMFRRKAGEMYSSKLINAHFWLATIGTVFYIAAMWVNGIMQGLMWRAVNADGTLTYSFVESVAASHWGYAVRVLGGALFLTGMLLMLFNVYMTVRDANKSLANNTAAAQA